ncbi:unnamed protein product [Effrenium voratum]|nr:unnamed protein product [Effrenium voratum]
MAPLCKLVIEASCTATNPGEELFAVGSCKELGSWDPVKGLQLETTPEIFPRWLSAQVEVIPGKVSFKLVIVGPGGARWEGGENRTMEIKEGQSKVTCSFGSDDTSVASLEESPRMVATRRLKQRLPNQRPRMSLSRRSPRLLAVRRRPWRSASRGICSRCKMAASTWT